MTSWRRKASRRDIGTSPGKFERFIFNRICSMVRMITSAFGFFKNKRKRRPRKSKKLRKPSKQIDVKDDFIYEVFADVVCALIFIYVSANLVLLVLLRACLKPILYAVGEKIQVKCCFLIIAALILLSILASS